MTYPVLDAHLHLWDLSLHHYGWLEDQLPLRRRFGPEDVDPGPYDLVGAVFVQADCRDDEAFAEVRWVVDIAGRLVRGIVAYAPVQDGVACESHLDKLAAQPLVVGVRRLLQGLPAAAIVDEKLVAGIRQLPKRNLTFDICVRHEQLSAAAELVQACPETSFVLDHVGKPAVADSRFDPWRADLARLAGFPNVSCKLSGLATEAGPCWSSATVRPYLEHALDVFGPTRCMIGSDWPVLTLAGTMESWYGAVQDAINPLTADEKEAVLCGTASSVYGIKP